MPIVATHPPLLVQEVVSTTPSLSFFYFTQQPNVSLFNKLHVTFLAFLSHFLCKGTVFPKRLVVPGKEKREMWRESNQKRDNPVHRAEVRPSLCRWNRSSFSFPYHPK